MGPLSGIRVVEFAGLGPAPIGAVMLADLGAEVIRIERKSDGEGTNRPVDSLLRNRRNIALNLKHPDGIRLALELIASADMLIEGFRPGVMEKLGLGPDVCLDRNPALVYGRATGWGQTGPLAQAAGHDINYIALSGLLNQVGTPGGKPVPPVCFAGDYAAGGHLLAFGLLAAWISAQRSGKGQVVDAAITDGAVAMMGVFYAFQQSGLVSDGPGEGYLAGSAPWYDTYETADGKYITIGPLEPQFFGLLLDTLGLDKARYAPLGFPSVGASARREWPALRAELTQAFLSKTRDQWCELLEGTDVCFAPVLNMQEAPQHPHNRARELFVEVDGVTQNAPVPKFSETTPDPIRRPSKCGEDTDAVLADLGYGADDIHALRQQGALS